MPLFELNTFEAQRLCALCVRAALFYALRDASLHNGTVASMQENEGMVRAKGGKGGFVKLVDVPGHERLRHKLEQHLAGARAVVFVVDATDITPHKVRGGLRGRTPEGGQVPA